LTRIRFAVKILCLLVSHAYLGHAAPLPADLFKEAQLQENTIRDQEAAIRLYREFLNQPGTDRHLQAQAILHLGICQSRLGRSQEAKEAWKKVVQDYSDQGNVYSEALSQLQQLQVAEVRASTPTVKVVYETSPARWMLEIPRATFLHALDGKGRLMNTTAGTSIGFTAYPATNLGITFELGSIGSSLPPSAHRSIAYFAMLLRKEKMLAGPLSSFAKVGPNLYSFRFENDRDNETKWTIGVSGELGLAVGLPRGFNFEFGYLMHLIAQTTPSEDFVRTIPAQDRSTAEVVTRNRGLRLAGGPTVALSFRW
jgi:hypothetical protein